MKITDLTSESVAGPEKCWPGHRKVGTKPGTGKNAGKRVNDCEKIKEEGVSLNEFAPNNFGGESGRWYTDDQMTDIVGDGWYEDLDVSGDIPKQQMIEQAQAWLDDQGYSVHVLNCKVNDDDMEWFIEGSFHNPRFAKKDVDEASLATMRDYFAGDDEARDPYEITKQRVHFSKDKNSKAPVQKKFNSKAEYEDWLEQQKNKKAFKVTEGVIIGPSETGDPMDPQVAVLGGAGSYSLKGLYNKAQRESAQLTKDIGLGNFRSSAYNVKQLENTLNTIVAAHNELEAVRKGGGAKSRGIERGVDTKE